jgi:DNA-binding protein YbaB
MMSVDPQADFESAVAELRRTQERIKSVSENLRAKPTEVSSKDKMVTVAVDERGEVTSITFNTAKFRRMAPAELGAVLVETIRQARAVSRDRLMSAYKPLLPPGLDMSAMMTGKFNVDKMFDEAVKRGRKMMDDGQRRGSQNGTTQNGTTKKG